MRPEPWPRRPMHPEQWPWKVGWARTAHISVLEVRSASAVVCWRMRHRQWVEAARRRLAHPRQRPRADPGNYHCQWFEAMRAVGEERVRAATEGGSRRDTFWQPCACPRGKRSDFDHGGDERSEEHIRRHMKHRWMASCATPEE